jgi:ion channel-forming bestrophin family protein
MVESLGWAAVPIGTMVALGFLFIGQTGRVLEDPFTMFFNGLPLAALSRTIERNCLELSGVAKSELPDNVLPSPQQVLI